MKNTFNLSGTVFKTELKEKYSKIVLKYFNGQKEQRTPFMAANQKVNDSFHRLNPGDEVSISFEVGGSEFKEKFYSNNWVLQVQKD